MAAEQVEFVVGGVYRRPRKPEGFELGMITEAYEEHGRLVGMIKPGGRVAESIRSDRMEGWVLVAKPGVQLEQVGVRYATEDGLKEEVSKAVSERLGALSDRLTQLEAEVIDLRGKVRDMKKAAEPAQPGLTVVDGLKARAKGASA